MKPSPTGPTAEACKGAGQDEKSCSVCQAWGKPPGTSPKAAPVPGPAVTLGPGPGTASTSGTGSGSAAVPGPRPESNPAPKPSPAAGPESHSAALSGSSPGAGAGPKPAPGLAATPGAGSVAEPRAAPLPGPAAGTGPKPSEPTTAPAQQKAQSTPRQAPRQKVLVTGGGGYLGFSLGTSLARSGASVILLDLRRPQWELAPGTEFIQADVRDEEALYRAFEGVDCVFHVASYGMSGAEKLQKEQIESINVGGTKLVIDVCVRRRVPRLVYTSTVNVAFGGKPIEQGDEDSVPYFPLEKHMDHYSRTKAIADQLTLMANGTPLPGGGTLRTCVLRPPGIYGPEEQRHLPRVAGHIKKRLFLFRFGDRGTRMNWVHVQNLVRAHVLAAEALTAAKAHVASGQAYYINDGESVNLFEWMAPLFEKLGYSQPWLQVPTSWVYLTATLMEGLHLALRPLFSLPPLLTRSEVCSVAVTHTFRIAKARTQLGYEPDRFSFAEVVERYVQSTHERRRGSTARTLLLLLLGVLLLLGLLALALHFLDLQPAVSWP